MSRDAKAFEVERDAEDLDISHPGAYYFLQREGVRIGILHGCPCGCGARSALFFAGSNSGHDEWTVTGEWPKATLKPSIGIKYDVNGNRTAYNGYHWHGFLADGVFTEQ